MALKADYMDIANRSILAAEAIASVNLQEAISFFAYHAFESMGGALCEHLNVTYPKSHDKKINQFVAVSGKTNHQKSVKRVAERLESLRNVLLYPQELSDGAYLRPSQQITLDQAKDLLKRVKGVYRMLEKYIQP